MRNYLIKLIVTVMIFILPFSSPAYNDAEDTSIKVCKSIGIVFGILIGAGTTVICLQIGLKKAVKSCKKFLEKDVITEQNELSEADNNEHQEIDTLESVHVEVENKEDPSHSTGSEISTHVCFASPERQSKNSQVRTGTIVKIKKKSRHKSRSSRRRRQEFLTPKNQVRRLPTIHEELRYNSGDKSEETDILIKRFTEEKMQSANKTLFLNIK